MLRALVVLLLLANLGYWAWSRGALPAGWLPPPPDGGAQREPQRRAAQLRPESIELLKPGAPPPAAAPAPPVAPALACLQAGPFGDAAWGAAWAAADRAGLLTDGWMRVTTADPAAGAWLRLPAARPPLVERLRALQDPAFGGGFRPCG
jgi:hypothetical protein